MTQSGLSAMLHVHSILKHRKHYHAAVSITSTHKLRKEHVAQWSQACGKVAGTNLTVDIKVGTLLVLHVVSLDKSIYAIQCFN